MIHVDVLLYCKGFRPVVEIPIQRAREQLPNSLFTMLYLQI